MLSEPAAPRAFDPCFSTAPALLYRQFFTSEECDRLDRTPPDSALSEISLLRVLISRLLVAARRAKMTFKRHFAMHSAFCQATSTMASLARIEFKQQGPRSPHWISFTRREPRTSLSDARDGSPRSTCPIRSGHHTRGAHVLAR